MDRVLAPSDNKREFYEKIGLVVFDRKIESIEDKEEALFLSNLTHLFGELERYTAFNEVNNETVYIDGHPFHVKSKFATNVKYNSSNCILLLPSGKLYCVEKRESILVWGMALFISLAVVLIAALVIGLLDAFFLPIPVEMRLLIMIGCGIISFLIVAMGMASVKELCEIKY